MLIRFSHCGLSYPRFEQITDVTSYLVACLRVDTKNASSSFGAHLYQEHTTFFDFIERMHPISHLATSRFTLKPSFLPSLSPLCPPKALSPVGVPFPSCETGCSLAPDLQGCPDDKKQVCHGEVCHVQEEALRELLAKEHDVRLDNSSADTAVRDLVCHDVPLK